MKTITSLNPAIAHALFHEIEQAIVPLAEKYGVSALLTEGRSTQNYAKYSIELAVKRPDGIPFGKLAEDFVKYADQYGLTAAHFGASFPDKNGTVLKVVGYRPRNRRPFVVEKPDGVWLNVIEEVVVNGFYRASGVEYDHGAFLFAQFLKEINDMAPYAQGDHLDKEGRKYRYIGKSSSSDISDFQIKYEDGQIFDVSSDQIYNDISRRFESGWRLGEPAAVS